MVAATPLPAALPVFGIAFETPEFFGRNHNHLVATVNRHMLRPLATHAAHQLAETSLGVLQQPVARTMPAYAAMVARGRRLN
jgi:hypothetical protein